VAGGGGEVCGTGGAGVGGGRGRYEGLESPAIGHLAQRRDAVVGVGGMG